MVSGLLLFCAVFELETELFLTIVDTQHTHTQSPYICVHQIWDGGSAHLLSRDGDIVALWDRRWHVGWLNRTPCNLTFDGPTRLPRCWSLLYDSFTLAVSTS